MVIKLDLSLMTPATRNLKPPRGWDLQIILRIRVAFQSNKSDQKNEKTKAKPDRDHPNLKNKSPKCPNPGKKTND